MHCPSLALGPLPVYHRLGQVKYATMRYAKSAGHSGGQEGASIASDRLGATSKCFTMTDACTRETIPLNPKYQGIGTNRTQQLSAVRRNVVQVLVGQSLYTADNSTRVMQLRPRRVVGI